MLDCFDISTQDLARLGKDPTTPITGTAGGVSYTATIGIPNYGEEISRHYASVTTLPLDEVIKRSGVEFAFKHFGFICRFDTPQELEIHDNEHLLDPKIRLINNMFGPVILKNAYLHEEKREKAQRNIFADLKFHFDRGSNQVEQYSLFSRNPFDPVQKMPRESSTAYIANLAGYLQTLKEEKKKEIGPGWTPTSRVLFANENKEKLMGKIILEHAWNEPEGTGEIAIINNRNLLHASYYRTPGRAGYPIGVRYVE